jgi:hypothetical protein
VVIAPNGTGDVQLDADTVRVGDAAAAVTLTSNGAGALTVTTGGAADLTLSTNSGTTSGTVVIANGVNGNITLTPDGTGDVILSADRVQIGDSNTDTTLTTNGTGSLNLTTNNGSNSGTIQIAQGINGNITLTPNGTGSVSVPKLVVSTATATRVPYISTGGLIIDDADLTFDGTTLSVGGLSNPGLSTLVKTLTLGNTSFSGTAVFAPATPAKLYIGTGTVTDTTSAASATNATGAVSSLAITPIAATNASVTYTNASTLYIAGAPSAGTNVTITNPYSLYVAAGDAYFGGTVTAGTVNLTTLDLTNLEVTNIKAKDGTASITLANTTGVASFTANPVLSGGTANGVLYLNGSKAVTSGSALVFDGTNLGVGISPSAWGSDTKAIQMAGSTFSAISADARLTLLANSYWDGTNWKYTNTGAALQYRVSAGTSQHEWYVAPSGSAGANITSGYTYPVATLGTGGLNFPTAASGNGNISYDGSTFTFVSNSSSAPMVFSTNSTERGRFLSNGNFGLGTTTPDAKLQVVGQSFFGAAGAYVSIGSPKVVFYGAGATETSALWFQAGVGSTLAGFKASNPNFFITNTYAGNVLGTNGIVISQNGLVEIFTSTTVDAVATVKATSANYAAIINIEAQNDNGAIYNYIASNTTGVTQHWKIGGGATTNTLAFSTAGSERARITSGGQFLVGNTTTSGGEIARFQTASGATSVGIIAATNGSSFVNFGDTSDANVGFIGYDHTSNYMNFRTNGAEAMRITSGGSLGVGTTVPNAKLTVWTASTTGLQTALRLNNPFGFDNVNTGAQIVFSQDRSTAEDLPQGSIGVGQESPGSSVNAYMAFSTNNTTVSEKMRISAAGLVGIGTNAPGQRLDVNGSIRARDGAFIASIGTATQGLFCTYNQIFGSGSDYTPVIFAETGLGITFAVNGTSTKAMTLNTSGNLLVGATSGGTDRGTFASPTASVNVLGLASTDDSSGGNFIMFRNSAYTAIGSVARVTTTNAVVYNTTSDYRLKTVTGAVTGQGARIDALKPIDYLWAEGGQQARGFLAHEFQAVYPNSVSGDKDAVDADGNPKYQAMQAATSEVIADLVAEIQSLRKRLANAGI